MTLFTGTETLLKNPEFQIQTEENQYYFTHMQGEKVKTDSLGKMIWECLPGTVHELTLKIEAQMNVPASYLWRYLYVLVKSDLIRQQSETKPAVREEIDQNDLVSVIVITFNGQKHLQDCFQSIQEQTYQNLEIIAVDNGSTDDTVAYLSSTFPRVKIFSLSKNRHYSGGVNYGINHSNGKYLFILNQDTRLDKECVAQIVKAFQSEPQAGAVVPMMKFFHRRGFINGIGNQIRNHGWGSDNFIGIIDIGQFDQLKEVPSACGGAVCMRRETVQRIGLWDEGYKSFYEDVDWSFRCWFLGWKIVPAVKAYVFHKFGASFPSRQKLRLVVRNRLRLVFKLFQGRIRLGFLKRYMLEDLRNCLSLLKKRQFLFLLTYLKAYLWFVLSLPAVWPKRWAVMRNPEKMLREKDVIVKNPEFFTLLDRNSLPGVNSEMMFGYYLQEIKRLQPQAGGQSLKAEDP